MSKSNIIMLVIGFVGASLFHTLTPKQTDETMQQLKVSLDNLTAQLSYTQNSENDDSVLSDSMAESIVLQEKLSDKLTASIKEVISQTVSEQIKIEMAGIEDKSAIKQTKSNIPTDSQAQIKIQQSVNQAEAIIAASIEKGVWEKSDMQAFNQTLSSLPSNDAVDIQTKFAAAVNKGEIKLADDVHPF